MIKTASRFPSLLFLFLFFHLSASAGVISGIIVRSNVARAWKGIATVLTTPEDGEEDLEYSGEPDVQALGRMFVATLLASGHHAAWAEVDVQLAGNRSFAADAKFVRAGRFALHLSRTELFDVTGLPLDTETLIAWQRIVHQEMNRWGMTGKFAMTPKPYVDRIFSRITVRDRITWSQIKSEIGRADSLLDDSARYSFVGALMRQSVTPDAPESGTIIRDMAFESLMSALQDLAPLISSSDDKAQK